MTTPGSTYGSKTADEYESKRRAEIHLKYAKKKQNWVLDNFDVTFPCIECGKPVTNSEGSSNCHDICRLEL